jgi:hypothetical protein
MVLGNAGISGTGMRQPVAQGNVDPAQQLCLLGPHRRVDPEGVRVEPGGVDVEDGAEPLQQHAGWSLALRHRHDVHPLRRQVTTPTRRDVGVVLDRPKVRWLAPDQGTEEVLVRASAPVLDALLPLCRNLPGEVAGSDHDVHLEVREQVVQHARTIGCHRRQQLVGDEQPVGRGALDSLAQALQHVERSGRIHALVEKVAQRQRQAEVVPRLQRQLQPLLCQRRPGTP